MENTDDNKNDTAKSATTTTASAVLVRPDTSDDIPMTFPQRVSRSPKPSWSTLVFLFLVVGEVLRIAVGPGFVFFTSCGMSRVCPLWPKGRWTLPRQ